MNRSWIVLVLAVVALASCSVEKRVYQPGYHIEWNHLASQDPFQDVSQGRSEAASQDLPQDLSENLESSASQDLPQDLSKNLEIDVAQDVIQGAAQGVSQGASQDLPQDLSENLSKNLETYVSQDMGQSNHSDFELLLFILLAIFLPALTIFLLEGFSKNFWIALLLMICAFSLPILAVVVRLILEVIAIILAISVVFHYM